MVLRLPDGYLARVYRLSAGLQFNRASDYGGVAVSDPLNPSPALLAKLGSVLIHIEEFMRPGGHDYDGIVLTQLLEDEEVLEWRSQMDALAMIPKLRR